MWPGSRLVTAERDGYIAIARFCGIADTAEFSIAVLDHAYHSVGFARNPCTKLRLTNTCDRKMSGRKLNRGKTTISAG